MAKTQAEDVERKPAHARPGKSERRDLILLDLKLRPHVRISELADRFHVSAETIRRDLDALSEDGLISRAHGGASAPAQGYYPGLDERANARIEERARIGRRAAEMVRDGETVMVDSGATTIQMARALAFMGTPCTVITNSIPVAMTLGHGAAEVLLCPGEYLAAESAVIGTETLEFLSRFNVDRCLVGSSGLSAEGPSESVRGFAAVKRVMLQRAESTALLVDSEKFGRKGLARFAELSDLDHVIAEARPKDNLMKALVAAKVELIATDEQESINRGKNAACQGGHHET